MKKLLLLIALALVSPASVMGQEQLPVQPSEQPQVQATEQQPAPPAPGPSGPQDRPFPQAFIHADKEYPAGDYRMVLTTEEGRTSVFFVANAQKELLFDELAIVKTHPAAGTHVPLPCGYHGDVGR